MHNYVYFILLECLPLVESLGFLIKAFKCEADTRTSLGTKACNAKGDLTHRLDSPSIVGLQLQFLKNPITALTSSASSVAKHPTVPLLWYNKPDFPRPSPQLKRQQGCRLARRWRHLTLTTDAVAVKRWPFSLGKRDLQMAELV